MKNVLISAAILAFSLHVSAQKEETPSYPGKGAVEFGTGIGVNFSTISSSDIEASTGTGFNVAVSGDYYFSNRWSIKGKLMYDQKGWNDALYNNGVISYNTNVDMNYLTIPIMANWHFGKNRQWYLNFGPYASFLMSAKETEGGDDVKESFNTSDFGLEIGIGVKIPLNDKLKLYFEYEDASGFSDVGKGDGTFRNSRGCFNVGLNFLMK